MNGLYAFVVIIKASETHVTLQKYIDVPSKYLKGCV